MWKSASIIVVIANAAVLVGCAQHVWVKPGAVQSDFDRDKSYCDYEAMKYAGSYDNSYRSAFGSSLDLALRRNEIAAACMRQLGWSTQQNQP